MAGERVRHVMLSINRARSIVFSAARAARSTAMPASSLSTLNHHVPNTIFFHLHTTISLSHGRGSTPSLSENNTMMLTTSFFAPSMQYHSAYTPPRPSPLAERSVNAVPRLFDFSMASEPTEKKTPMSKRAYKPNPLIQSRDAATKRRRDMFFNRVQNSREDKHWEKRGEQVRFIRRIQSLRG